MLVDEIRARMRAAMKARNTAEKEVLRVALGEITRTGESLSDKEVQAILRKLAKSNRETLSMTEDAEQRATLEVELAVLDDLLPRTLSEAEVSAALAPVVEQIKACGNDGQATGVAMKHLKAQGADVDGRTVSAAVKAMRAG